MMKGIIMKILPGTSHIHRNFNRILFTGVIGIFLLAGCSNMPVKKEMQIPLVKDVRQSGTYQDFDYLIDYRYVFKQQNLQQPGEIDLTFELRRRRAHYSLTVWVNFLDSEGQILEKRIIYSLGNRNRISQTLEGPLESPPGTVAIAFTSTARDFKSRQ
jgi:hypothetical protein